MEAQGAFVKPEYVPPRGSKYYKYIFLDPVFQFDKKKSETQMLP